MELADLSLELVDDERTVCLGASIGLDRNVAGQCARFAEKLHDWRNYAPVSRERELAAVKAVAEGRHE